MLERRALRMNAASRALPAPGLLKQPSGAALGAPSRPISAAGHKRGRVIGSVSCDGANADRAVLNTASMDSARKHKVAARTYSEAF